MLLPRKLSLKQPNLVLLGFVIQSAVLFGVSPFQGDGHHDGIVFAPSVAFSEGLVVQKDAFSQYGPLNVWLYGSILKLFPNQVLVLRIAVALLSLITAWVLFQVLKRTSLSNRAILITTTWITANAVYMTSFPASPLPWASVTANLFALIGLFFLVAENRDKKQNKALFLSGLFFGVSVFARVQFIALIPILLLLMLVTKTLMTMKSLVWMALGFVFGMSFIVYILLMQGALIPYVNQSIVFPITKYPSFGYSTNYNLYLFTLLLTVPIFAFGLLFLIKKLIKSFSTVLATIMILSLLLVLNFVSRWVVPNSTLPLIPRVVIGEIIEKSGLWLGYSSALVCLVAPLMLLKKHKLHRDTTSIGELATIATGFIGVLQLYPYPDVQHLWWASPILIPALHFAPKVALTKEFLLLCKCTILTGLILFVYFLHQPWYEFKNHSMKGVYSTQEKTELYEVFLPIEKYTDSRSYRFDCEDGIHSVAGGKYLSVDKWFVNWGNIQNNSRVPRNVKAIFICDKKIAYAQRYASQIGWKVAFYDAASNGSGYRSLAILEPKPSAES